MQAGCSGRAGWALSIAALVALCVVSLLAHDIPADIAIQAFVKPEGRRLVILVRAPLRAMRDVELPLRDGAYVDIPRSNVAVRSAATLWIGDSLHVYEDNAQLPPGRLVRARVSMPSDRAFASFDTAQAHVDAPPLPDDTTIAWDQAMLDVMFEYPIASDRARFSIDPDFSRLGIRVVTAVRFLPPGRAERAFELAGSPGVVHLDPRWHQAALGFVRLGFLHILDGTDHLLFLLCLVIPFRRLKGLVILVTAFTVAHTITLMAAAYDLAPDALWFPPLVETLIAMSVVYMALENIVGTNNLQRRWVITFAFGLVHGFGFSFGLKQTLQFAGSHLLLSLVSFNLGVELGQLLLLATLVPALTLAFRYVVAERMGTIILSALIAHTAWHWMTERWERLSRFAWPSIDAVVAARLLWWLTIAVIAAGLVWFVRIGAGRKVSGLWSLVFGPAPRRLDR
jgi:HupE/UreJ protein